MMKKLFILLSACAMSYVSLISCTGQQKDTADSSAPLEVATVAYTAEEQARIDECNKILDEYKEYWVLDSTLTKEQHDSILLKVGPDSIRDLLQMFVNGELNQVEI